MVICMAGRRRSLQNRDIPGITIIQSVNVRGGKAGGGCAQSLSHCHPVSSEGGGGWRALIGQSPPMTSVPQCRAPPVVLSPRSHTSRTQSVLRFLLLEPARPNKGLHPSPHIFSSPPWESSLRRTGAVPFKNDSRPIPRPLYFLSP